MKKCFLKEKIVDAAVFVVGLCAMPTCESVLLYELMVLVAAAV